MTMMDCRSDVLPIRICQLRKYHGLTQDGLSKRINEQRHSIADIEVGRKQVKIDTLIKICKVFDLSIDDMVSDNFTIWKYSKTHESINGLR